MVKINFIETGYTFAGRTGFSSNFFSNIRFFFTLCQRNWLDALKTFILRYFSGFSKYCVPLKTEK